MQDFDRRGEAEYATAADFVRNKYHGLTNNVANVYMPPIALLRGPERAYSLWKYSALVLCAALLWSGSRGRGFRRLFLASLPVILPLTGASFYLMTGLSPWSWRTSLPALVGLCLTLAVLSKESRASTGARWISRLLVASMVLSCALASVIDAQRRTWVAARDRIRLETLLDPEIKSRREVRLVVIEGRDENGPPFPDGFAALTQGFEQMHSWRYSSFADPWTMKHLIAYRSRTLALNCEETTGAPICSRGASRARHDVRRIETVAAP